MAYPVLSPTGSSMPSPTTVGRTRAMLSGLELSDPAVYPVWSFTPASKIFPAIITRAYSPSMMGWFGNRYLQTNKVKVK